MSRLMLNLHRTAAQQSNVGDTTMDPDSMTTGTLQFTTRMGISASMFEVEQRSSDCGTGSTTWTHRRGQNHTHSSDIPPIVEVFEFETADVDVKRGFNSAAASPVSSF